MYSITATAHIFSFLLAHYPPALPSFPTRRSSDLASSAPARARHRAARRGRRRSAGRIPPVAGCARAARRHDRDRAHAAPAHRSEEHTSELQSRPHLVCRLLLEKKKQQYTIINHIV